MHARENVPMFVAPGTHGWVSEKDFEKEYGHPAVPNAGCIGQEPIQNRHRALNSKRVSHPYFLGLIRKLRVVLNISGVSSL